MDSLVSEVGNIIENQTQLLQQIKKSHRFFQLHFAMSILGIPVYAAFLTLFFIAFETIFMDVSFFLALLIVSITIGVGLAVSLGKTYGFLQWSHAHLKGIVQLEGDTRLYAGITVYLNRLFEVIFRDTLHVTPTRNSDIQEVANRLKEGMRRKFMYAIGFLTILGIIVIFQVTIFLTNIWMGISLLSTFIGFFAITIVEMLLMQSWVNQVYKWVAAFDRLHSLRDKLNDLYRLFSPKGKEVQPD
jgi:uncharacterized membrane protein (DUF485 family)